MKKRILASLLSLYLIVGLLPAAALAADESGTEGEAPAVCTCTALCAEGAVDETCPVCAEDDTLCAYTEELAPADEGEPAPCTVTDGCTLEAGHEGVCIIPAEQERNDNSFYESEDVTDSGESIMPLDIDTTAEQGIQESPWNISADGEGNKVIAYLTQNSDNSTYTLIISGQGRMEDFTVTDESDTRPWVDFVSSITAVYVNDGVTKIGARAFYSCVALANVVFGGNTLQEIGESCFYDTPALTTIKIPKSVTVFGMQIFCRSGLESIEFEDGIDLTTIPAQAFDRCSNLAAITLPSSVAIIGQLAFRQCSSLASIDIQGSLTSISAKAFSGCDKILHIKIPGIQIALNNVYYQDKGFYSATVSVNILGLGTNVKGIGPYTIPSYTFDGWYDRAGTCYRRMTGNYSHPISVETTVYAVYKGEISFDTNGGSGNASSIEAGYYIPGLEDGQTISLANKTFTLPGNSNDTTFNRDGYTFAGWNTKADGTGTHYNGDASISAVNSTTLYAEWEKKIGESTSCTVNAIADQTYTGAAIEPTVVVKDSNGNILTGGFTVSYSNNTNVGTAQATVQIGNDTAEVKFKISQDNSPTVSMADVSVTYGTAYTMTATAATSAGNAITDGNITIKYYTNEGCTEGETTTAPTDAGTYYAKATLTKTDNYAEATKIAKITISKATFEVFATGYSGTYDGQPHSITVTADGAEITYSADRQSYSGTNPTYTNAGAYTVYYTATKPNHDDVTGSVTVEIKKAPLTATYVSESVRYGNAPALAVEVTGFVNDETAETAASYNAPTVTNSNTANGTYTLTPAGGSADNYEFNYVPGTLTIYSSGGGGGGSSSGSTTYTVSTDSSKNGSVSVSPKNASKGTIVTVTVIPNSGYELNTLTVTDKDGDKIKLTDKGNGKYTFKMPASKVTVKVVFAEIGEQPEIRFTDVPAGAYYADAVDWAVENGVTKGISDTVFGPDLSCTRAQMVTFLWRAAGSPVVNDVMSFTDVPADTYYADAVRWAVFKGITSGTSATTFAPDMTVTRSQTVTFLYRAAGTPAVSGGSFADVPADVYYADAVAWAVREGVTSGTSATTFSPNADCTRGQIVTFMYRNTMN